MSTFLTLACFTSLPSLFADEASHAAGIGLKVLPEKAGSPAVEATTDEAFIARRNASQEKENAPKPLPPKASAFSLMEMSTAIQNGNDFILVPKGAVIFCPPALEPKLVKQPVGKFTEWSYFMSSNRSWITTFEVSQDQVTGKTPIPPDTIERFRKGGSIVIATLKGGPITVLRPTP